MSLKFALQAKFVDKTHAPTPRDDDDVRIASTKMMPVDGSTINCCYSSITVLGILGKDSQRTFQGSMGISQKQVVAYLC